ncbi:hypothetical protein CLU79DRAFT_63088 [Phycomyces nitens]|nr:hypothetical protein CLU79DRAFT_63088 [Phycomyces nitens]
MNGAILGTPDTPAKQLQANWSSFVDFILTWIDTSHSPQCTCCVDTARAPWQQMLLASFTRYIVWVYFGGVCHGINTKRRFVLHFQPIFCFILAIFITKLTRGLMALQVLLSQLSLDSQGQQKSQEYKNS